MAQPDDPSTEGAKRSDETVDDRPPMSEVSPSEGTTADAPSRSPGDESPPRKVIHGYRLLREISRGGQAVVYQAIQESTGRKVAVKVMREGSFAGAREKARFDREVQTLAALDHPNIVQVIDRGTAVDGSLFLVMNYIAGCTLDEYIAEYYRKNPGGPPPSDPSELLRLFLKIADAVSAAHIRGIVHRDLKPSNIRIDGNNEPHVLDFGLAHTALSNYTEDGQVSPLSISGQFMGSLPWASPEQAKGDSSLIDTRTDVYSLGVILYQMITRRFPYEVTGTMVEVLNTIIKADPTPPSQIIAANQVKTVKRLRRRTGGINPSLEAIILKALAKKREDRYQTAGELARDVGNYLAGKPTLAGSTSSQRHWDKSVLTASALVLMVVICGFFVWRIRFHRKSAVTPVVPQTQPFVTHTDDLKVNSAQGRELCFVKGSWDAGLPLLAKGDDATLKDLASRELAAPPNGEAQFQLAAGWWDVAQQQIEPAKSQVQQHAAEWYLRARQELSEVDEARIESQMPAEMREKFVALTLDRPTTVPDSAIGRVIRGPTPPDSMQFHPDGRSLLLNFRNTETWIVNLATGRIIPNSNFIAGPRFSGWSHKGNILVDGGGRMLPWPYGTELPALEGAAGYQEAVFSADDSRIATFGGADGRSYSTTRVFQTADGKKPLLEVHPEIYEDRALLSPDGHRLASFGSKGAESVVQIWEVQKSGREITHKTWPRDIGYMHASFSSDSSRFCCTSLSGWVGIFDAASGTLIKELTIGNIGNQGMVVAPSGSNFLIAQIADSGSASIWEAPSGRKVTVLDGQLKDEWRVAFSPTGDRLLGAHGHTAMLWNCADRDGTLLSQFDVGSQAEVSALAFSADGNYAAIGASDKTIHIWALPGANVHPVNPAATQQAVPADDTLHIFTDAVTLKRVVDLMPLIDVKRDAESGEEWTRDASGLHSGEDDPFALLEIPYLPPDQYDFHIEFTRLSGHSSVHQIISHAGHQVTWMMGGNGKASTGFALVGGKQADDNLTGKPADDHLGGNQGTLVTGHRYSSVVKVRKKSISAYLTDLSAPDGPHEQLMADFPTDYSDLTVPSDWSTWGQGLGVGSRENQTIFHKIEVVEITGAGKFALEHDDRQIQVLKGHLAFVEALVYSPDGRYLLSGSSSSVRDDPAILWDLKQGKPSRTYPDKLQAYPGAFSDDGRWMLVYEVAGREGRWVWGADRSLVETETGKPIRTAADGQFTPDGKLLARDVNFDSGITRGVTRVIDLATNKELNQITGNYGWYTAAKQGWFVSHQEGDKDGFIVRVDENSGKQIWSQPLPLPYLSLKWMAIVDQDRRIVVMGDSQFAVLDSSTGTVLSEMTGDAKAGVAMTHTVPTRDGQLVLAACNADLGLRMWKTDKKEATEITSRFTEQPGPAFDITLSPDDTEVALACADGLVRLFDLNSGKLITKFIGHRGAVKSVAFSHDGKTLASGGIDRTIRIWKLPPVENGK